jgi:hypothetical protein
MRLCCPRPDRVGALVVPLAWKAEAQGGRAVLMAPLIQLPFWAVLRWSLGLLRRNRRSTAH